MGNSFSSSGLRCVSQPHQTRAKNQPSSGAGVQIPTSSRNKGSPDTPACHQRARERAVVCPAPPCRPQAEHTPSGRYLFSETVVQKKRINLVSTSRTTRSNGLKLQAGTFRVDIKINFLTARVVKHQKRRPREGVKSPLREVVSTD